MLKTETFAKLFFLVSCTGLLMYVVLAFYTFHTAYTAISQVQKFRDRIQNFPSTDVTFSEDRFRNDLKYILFWPTVNLTHNFLESGQGVFINYNCSYFNCYVTTNKYLLNGDYRNFEAIVFNASVFNTWEEQNLPQRRLTKQKYIFYSAEPCDSSPMCNLCAENYFNWTWTYKLSSDIPRPFIEVRDTNNVVVAPKQKVKWLTDVLDINDIAQDKEENNNHTKLAVACIIDKCVTKSNRTEYAKRLQIILKRKQLVLDIYGCSFLKCPGGSCINDIKNKYYFYLAYEESFAMDYVTSEVIRAYDIGAIPLVAGGANYHKFLPVGSYINARNKSIENLVDLIQVIIKHPAIYNSFHKWRKHYVIRETRQFEGICDLCKSLNDDVKFKTRSSLKNFRSWWYSGSLYEKCKIDPDPSERPQQILNVSDLSLYYNLLHPDNGLDENE
ncbi:alpha-(1,3)-fucosyltransferase C-like [Battus philenor]|uniref:alpha-(1,3)-fucosyltransferase C-like n=1 Tax=Battus philenor TaxID=42288 RepID=UPI0035CF458F